MGNETYVYEYNMVFFYQYYMVSPKQTLTINQQFMVVRTYTKQSLSRVHYLTCAPSRGIMDQLVEGIWGFITISKSLRIQYVNPKQMAVISQYFT